jgi:hypothetical protein
MDGGSKIYPETPQLRLADLTPFRRLDGRGRSIRRSFEAAFDGPGSG